MLFRRGLAELLGDAGIDVVAQVGDVPRLMSAVDALAPDAAVVDVRMPPEHTDEGIRAALALRKQYPSVGVLVLSTYIETGWVARLLGAGTDGLGYLLKDRVDDVQSSWTRCGGWLAGGRCWTRRSSSGWSAAAGTGSSGSATGSGTC